MAEPELTQLHRNGDIPDKVVMAADEQRVGFTPRELTAILVHFGKPWSKIMADDESDDKFVVLAWLKLRRDGFDIPVEAMDGIVIELDASMMADPTSVARPTISPPSATSGE